jgi:hypothetical protein
MSKTAARFALACTLLFATAALFAVPASQAPKEITIADCQSKKPAVNFPHAQHFATFECKTCHHMQPDLKAGAATEVQACRNCHVTPEKADTPICSSMSTTKNPFHALCVNCHKEQVAKNADSKAPTRCDQCHVKG